MKKRHYGRIGTVPQRTGSITCAVGVHLSQVLGGQCFNATCGARRIPCAVVTHDSLPEIQAGHNPRRLRIFSCPLTLVCEEKEHPVLVYRTAYSRSESIANQLTGHIGQPRLQLSLLVEPVIGFSDVGPVIFVN